MKIITKHKKIVSAQVGALVTGFVLLSSNFTGVSQGIDTYDKVIADGEQVYVKNSNGSMIPDIYNTGPNPNTTLEKISVTNTDTEIYVGEVKFINRSDMGTGHVALDFGLFNTTTDTVVIENKDFSDLIINLLNSHHFGENGETRTIIFKNCKFGSFVGARVSDPAIHFEFYDSEFTSVSGSFMKFERCKIHGSSGDAMNPYREVSVKDSYIYNVGNENSGGTHVDGFQSYGNAAFDMDNISFNNVRIELPKYKIQNTAGEWVIPLVNAPAMVQVEFSEHSNNITLEKMHLNGGGYTIYAHCVKDCQAMTNLTIKDTLVGYGHMFGIMYPNHENMDESNDITGAEHLDSLYAGSTWKSSTGVHMSVTNELLNERMMTCVANNGTTTKTVAAHPTITQHMDEDDVPVYEDFPYDLDIVVADKDATEVDCYDTTNTGDVATSPLIKSARFESASNPTEPTDPTEPTEPTTPTDPTTPTNPTEPTDPTDPTTPTDPTEPTDPTTPTDPTEPADPAVPNGSTDPTEPTEPATPEGTTEETDLAAPNTGINSQVAASNAKNINIAIPLSILLGLISAIITYSAISVYAKYKER